MRLRCAVPAWALAAACVTRTAGPITVEVCPPEPMERADTIAPVVEPSVQGRETRGRLVVEGVPAPTPAVEARVSAYQNARRARLLGFEASGALLVRTRFASTDQVHRVERPGAARRQLTFSKEPIGEVVVSKNQKSPAIVYSADTGGNERYQVYRLEADGRGTLLSDGKSSNRSLVISNDGTRVAYTSTERNGKDFDVWVAEIATGKRSMVFQSPDGWWVPLDWAPDDTKLALLHPTSVTKTSLHVLELSQGIANEVAPTDKSRDVSHLDSAVFSSDGDLFYASDEGRDTKSLLFRDLESGKDKVVTKDLPFDVERVFSDPDRRRVGVTVNARGFSEARFFDAKTLRPLPAPVLPKGVVIEAALSREGTFAFTFETPQSPADVFSVKLGASARERWTESEAAGMRLDRIAETELIEFPTFDKVKDAKGQETSRMIPAFVTRPKGDGPFPVVVLIHGGPEAQTRPMFSAQTAMLAAEMGIAVVQPNVRGSTGYGRTFTMLDNGRLREDAVKDIGALLEALPKVRGLDPSRVALLGGSYGGFMVLASGIRFSERIRAIVDVVGISHFVTFLESTEEYRRDLRRVEYGDERDPEMRTFLQSVSPLTSAHEIKDPLFVVQGQNDPRVPVGEAEQIVKKVREQQEVWYMLALDEGHGFRKKENQDALMSAISAFLEKNLLGAQP